MRFDGEQLRAILEKQMHPVEVRDYYGQLEVVYKNARRAPSILNFGAYYGVGSRTRIWFIQPETAADRVAPWGTNLKLDTMTQGQGQRISRKNGAKDRLRWEQRADKGRTGITGKVSQVWLRDRKPDTGLV